MILIDARLLRLMVFFAGNINSQVEHERYHGKVDDEDGHVNQRNSVG